MFNKKGLSLVELIVAIGLISIVIVFLYSLLSDLNNELTNSSFAVNNQIIRFEIIKTIQSDMLDSNVDEITYSDNVVTIQYDNSDKSYIVIDSTMITYTDKSGIITKWEMDSTCYLSDEITLEDSDTGIYLNIEVYTSNEFNSSGNNNSLDDITINYLK